MTCIVYQFRSSHQSFSFRLTNSDQLHIYIIRYLYTVEVGKVSIKIANFNYIIGILNPVQEFNPGPKSESQY